MPAHPKVQRQAGASAALVDPAAIGRLFGLTGKVALVTGAAQGIGRAVAELFVRAGATVIAADLNASALEDFASGGGEGQAGLAFDQGDPASIAALFEAVDERHGTLDVVVNAAAIFPFKPFEEVDTALFDRVVAVNLRGVFQCVQRAVAVMKRQDRGGSIVNIASVNALRACIFDNVHYGLTKAGVNNITRSIALEYAGHNIRVNSVMPGAVATDHARRAAQEAGPALRGPFLQPGRMPLTGLPTSPDQIANACLFLASDASSYVTGQLLAVDGGFLVS